MPSLLSKEQLDILRDAAIKKEIATVEQELNTGEYSRSEYLDQCNKELAKEFEGAHWSSDEWSDYRKQRIAEAESEWMEDREAMLREARDGGKGQFDDLAQFLAYDRRDDERDIATNIGFFFEHGGESLFGIVPECDSLLQELKATEERLWEQYKRGGSNTPRPKGGSRKKKRRRRKSKFTHMLIGLLLILLLVWVL